MRKILFAFAVAIAPACASAQYYNPYYHGYVPPGHVRICQRYERPTIVTRSCYAGRCTYHYYNPPPIVRCYYR